ncbi:MAG: hypothetical protein E6Q37_01435 [Crocinitomicaceae bacterium]|nr:MAG: hypothetical protein E6Q37_01435 [Crocinitomicaceae bacterium]
MTTIKLLPTKDINTLVKEVSELKSIEDYKRFWSDFEYLYQSYPRNELAGLLKKFNDLIKEDASEGQLAEFLSRRLLISRAQASNPQYWITLNFIYFSDFIRKLYETKSDEVDKLKINLQSYFIPTSSQSSLLKGPISGLWWAAKITVLPDFDYRYTYKFLQDRNLRFKNLGGHQIIRHQPALLALLDFLEENRDAKYKDTGNYIGSEAIAQAMSKTLNQVAGTRLITIFNQQEIREILEKYKQYIIRLAIAIHEGKREVVEENNLEQRIGNQIISDSHNEGQNLTDFLIKEPLPIKPVIETQSPPSLTVVGTSIKQPHEINNNIDRHFLYNKISRKYRISKEEDENFDIAIGFSSTRIDQVLLHFYKQGKINRTVIGPSIKNLNLETMYSNGSNQKLDLLDIQIVNSKFLIGIAYCFLGVTYHKLYKEDILKKNNQDLKLEGKQLMEKGSYDCIAYKILPYDFIYEIDENRIYSSPTARGTTLLNPSFSDYWKKLQKYWPELFTEELFKDCE